MATYSPGFRGGHFGWAPGGMELLLILFIVLLLFGAKRLPELAKGLGQSVKEFKKASSEDEPAKPAAPMRPRRPSPGSPATAAPLPAPTEAGGGRPASGSGRVPAAAAAWTCAPRPLHKTARRQ